ncbi:AMP-binding protein, partial [Croceitalea sp. MTPC5]|uniref:AMP-binding protein n=1 Tax=Croceitalea sp. MTPC5 TaxID=3056565 RepID=UPI0030CB6DE0
GSTLFVVPNALILEPHRFARFLSDNRVSHLDTTPSYLSAIDPSELVTLKRVVFGGEYLSRELFEKYKRYIPGTINEYGPTETTICSTSFSSGTESTVPIGKPLGNTKAYVVDSKMGPLPVGVIGELYLSGVGVTRGY